MKKQIRKSIKKLTVQLYFITIIILCIGAGINHIEPKAVAYIGEPDKPYPIIFEVEYDWSDEEKIKEAIRKTFPENPNTFIRIAECESGLLPHAYNDKTDDSGVFQINEYHWSDWYEAKELDPLKVEDALVIARHIYDIQGLSAWNASKKCWSK